MFYLELQEFDSEEFTLPLKILVSAFLACNVGTVLTLSVFVINVSLNPVRIPSKVEVSENNIVDVKDIRCFSLAERLKRQLILIEFAPTIVNENLIIKIQEEIDEKIQNSNEPNYTDVTRSSWEKLFRKMMKVDVFSNTDLSYSDDRGFSFIQNVQKEILILLFSNFTK